MTLTNGQHWPLNTAYEGDCLGFMRELPDKCIDLVLTDPPYGINMDGGNVGYKGDNNFKKKNWDSEIPSQEIFKEIKRISKHSIIWGGNYFTDYLPPMASWLIWDKREGLPERTFADCELAFTDFGSPARIFRHKWDGMIQENMKNKEVRIHPTQKPLRLFKWCLEKYAKPGDLIFDPFLGSFTTAVACAHMGFDWIGCERDADYFKAGMERYENETKQQFFDFI